MHLYVTVNLKCVDLNDAAAGDCCQPFGTQVGSSEEFFLASVLVRFGLRLREVRKTQASPRRSSPNSRVCTGPMRAAWSAASETCRC